MSLNTLDVLCGVGFLIHMLYWYILSINVSNWYSFYINYAIFPSYVALRLGHYLNIFIYSQHQSLGIAVFAAVEPEAIVPLTDVPIYFESNGWIALGADSLEVGSGQEVVSKSHTPVSSFSISSYPVHINCNGWSNVPAAIIDTVSVLNIGSNPSADGELVLIPSLPLGVEILSIPNPIVSYSSLETVHFPNLIQETVNISAANLWSPLPHPDVEFSLPWVPLHPNFPR